ncbi:MAG TPA: hypothetical protein PKG77_24110 [Phycisphaerae bacterium]|nr:hypothetical protein [Phycisphaerae bacterium]HQL75952.1 hypothetical protein [Phycisphaerae bacterium]
MFSIAVLAAVAGWTGCSSKPRPPADPAKQAERLAFVQKMVDLGAVHAFEPDLTVPRLYVKEPFYRLTIDQKQKLVSIAFAYCHDAGGATLMTVHDYQTGKEIGNVADWHAFEMK